MEMSNLDLFINLVDEDLAWRKKEISEFLFLHNEDRDFLILKTSILLMYSHWEGYVKNISKQYLMFISKLEVPLNNLSTNFEAIIIKADIRECFKSSDTLNLANEIEFLNKIYDDKNKLFKLPSAFEKEKDKTVINTNDNLNIKTFLSFLKIIGVYNFEAIESRVKYIDEKLLCNRNIIAHGSKLHPNAASFQMDLIEIKKLRNFILIIMEFLKEELVYFAEHKLYLYSNQSKVLLRAEFRNHDLECLIKEIYPI